MANDPDRDVDRLNRRSRREGGGSGFRRAAIAPDGTQRHPGRQVRG
jgi:hypothetical protein